jgi:hypothetical protein
MKPIALEPWGETLVALLTQEDRVAATSAPEESSRPFDDVASLTARRKCTVEKDGKVCSRSPQGEITSIVELATICFD